MQKYGNAYNLPADRINSRRKPSASGVGVKGPLGLLDRARCLLRRSPGLPLFILLMAVWAGSCLWGKPIRSGEFLLGDCPYYASTAVSLWVDGDLDLRNQLSGGLEVHQRQIALGSGGEWYPKHPILMPILTIPFYVMFGVPGFLIFNLLVLGALGVVLRELCRRHVGDGLASLSVLAILAGTFLRAYAYNYSPDLFSALLLLGGLLLIFKDHPLAAGALLGLAVMAKITNIFALVLVLGFLWFRPARGQAMRVAAMAVPSLLVLALLNTAMFGSPTVSGYDRTLVLENGIQATVSHRGFFDLPVLEGITGQLFSPRTGLIPTSPLLLLALPGFFLLLKRRPWEGLLVLGLCEFTFLLFSTYRWWATSHYGNRFLMAPVALSVVPLALTLDWLSRAWQRRASVPSLAPAATRGRSIPHAPRATE